MLSDHQATITPHSGTARFKTDPTTSPTRQETPMLTQILDVTPPAWFAKARCQDGVGTLTELFFSEDLGDIARAKAICANCAVADQCLSAAVARHELWGVWGGELLMNGKILASRKRRGRPPKIARADYGVDELGQILPEVISA